MKPKRAYRAHDVILPQGMSHRDISRCRSSVGTYFKIAIRPVFIVFSHNRSHGALPHYFTTASVFRSVRPRASTVTTYSPSAANPPFRSRPSQRTRFAPAFIDCPTATSRTKRPDRLYTRTVTGAGRARLKLMPTSRSANAPVGENTRGVKASAPKVPVPETTPVSTKRA